VGLLLSGRAGTLISRFTRVPLHLGHATDATSDSRRTSVSNACSHSSHVNSYRGIRTLPSTPATPAIDFAGSHQDLALTLTQTILAVLLDLFQDLIELRLEMLIHV
jgi:hypothetical protein